MRRRDGSIQSANLPAYNKLAKNRIDKDNSIYRCMIVKVNFVGDPDNTTFQNSQVTYEAVILGGPKEGQILQNVKAMSDYGGEFNYSERIYRPIATSLKSLPLSDHVGDIVFVGFLQGFTRAPVIIGAGVQPNDIDFTGATREDGFIDQRQYNGIYTSINKNGEYLIQRKGGTLDPDSGVFVPDQNGNLSSFQLKDTQSIHMAGGTVVTMDGATDSVNVKTKGGGEVNVVGDRIAIGNGTAELFQQLSNALQKLITFFNNVDATHDHIGNLGYPSSPPETAAQFTQLGTDLSAIKGLIDAIKGTL